MRKLATSTFGKQFAVRKDNAKEFVDEMTQKAAPTLPKNFRSNLVYEKDYKDSLLKALR